MIASTFFCNNWFQFNRIIVIIVTDIVIIIVIIQL